jgi:hypothetical protein
MHTKLLDELREKCKRGSIARSSRQQVERIGEPPVESEAVAVCDLVDRIQYPNAENDSNKPVVP